MSRLSAIAPLLNHSPGYMIIPGDVIYDGFSGTGMTGVAAQILNRKAILSDLSPINPRSFLERKTGLEPATYSLEGCRSTK